MRSRDSTERFLTKHNFIEEYDKELLSVSEQLASLNQCEDPFNTDQEEQLAEEQALSANLQQRLDQFKNEIRFVANHQAIDVKLKVELVKLEF